MNEQVMIIDSKRLRVYPVVAEANVRQKEKFRIPTHSNPILIARTIAGPVGEISITNSIIQKAAKPIKIAFACQELPVGAARNG